MKKKIHYKTIVISDVHLGTKSSKARELLKFLKRNPCDKLILNGDIIDGWLSWGMLDTLSYYGSIKSIITGD